MPDRLQLLTYDASRQPEQTRRLTSSATREALGFVIVTLYKMGSIDELPRENSSVSIPLVLQAWTELLYIDLIGMLGFRAIRGIVTSTPIRSVRPGPAALAAVIAAVQTACALYFKSAYCLQRSAAVTRLLRRRGIAADMVIGCHLPVLKAHAWVEVSGDVVSDHLTGLEHYHVLDKW